MAPLIGVSAASADPGPTPAIRSAQARATALEAQIQAESNRVNALSEEYDLASMKAQQAAERLQKVQSQVAAAKAQVTAAEVRVRKVAVADYVGKGRVSSLGALFQSNASTLAVRQVFLQAGANNQQDVIDHFQAAKRALSAQEAVMAAAKQQADADTAKVKAAADAARRETASEQATLSQVKGQIATLIAAYQAKQAAIRRARAEAAAQAAAQAAAARAAAQAAQLTSQEGSGPSNQGGPPSSAAPSPPVPASGGSGAVAVRAALAEVGKPYVWGGSGPYGFDCSGLVMYAWSQAGVGLPHYTVSQYDDTARVSAGDLQPGDLVFYDVPGEPDPGHVALYIGGGQIVVADTTGTPVRVESMYYDGTPMGFGRVG